jgi:hypothetical protein
MSYEVDEGARRKVDSSFSGKRVLGIECPLRNNTGPVCKECDRARKLWRMGTESSQQEARDRFAKPTYFANVVLQDNNNHAVLKLGKKVSADILDELEETKGPAFKFADPEEGRWVSISKKGTRPSFEYRFRLTDDVAPTVEKATVDNLNSLNNVTEDFNDGNIDLFDISSLESGGALSFRLLPSPTGTGKYKLLQVVHYHWRCNEADILGGEDPDEMDKPVELKDDSEFEEYMTVDETEETDEVKAQYSLDEAESVACFGNYDGDEMCMAYDCDIIREPCAIKNGYVKDDDGEFVKKKVKKVKKQ